MTSFFCTFFSHLSLQISQHCSNFLMLSLCFCLSVLLLMHRGFHTIITFHYKIFIFLRFFELQKAGNQRVLNDAKLADMSFNEVQ